MVAPFRLVLAALATLALIADSPAQDPLADRELRLDDVIVVATSHEREQLELPWTAYRINAYDIRLRLQVGMLPDALAEVPGVLLQKTGHGMTSPHLRGLTGQRVLLLADGVRLNNSTFREGPNQYWTLVDPYFYDDLEVVMGPASVLYGSDAIGGVVLARSSLPPRGAPDAGVQWGGGSALFRYASAEAAFSEHLESAFAFDDRWSFKLGLTRQDVGELTTGGGEENPNTNYEQWGANLRAVRWFDDDRRLILGFDQTDQDDVGRVHRTVDHVDYEDTIAKGQTGDRHRTYDHDRRVGFARYEVRRGDGLIEEADVQLSWQYLGEDYHRVRLDGRQERRHTATDSYGARLRLQSPSPLGTWNYGVETSHEIVSSYGHNVTGGVKIPLIQGDVGDDSRYTQVGVFVQNELPLGDRWELFTGLRYSYADLEAAHVNFSGTDRSLRGNWDAVTGGARLSYLLLPDQQVRLFAGVAQGFRAPNLSDATREGEFGGGVEAPTADLDAERFTTWELGAKSAGKWGYAQVTGYYTRLHNQIFRLATPTTKRHADDGYVQGLEAAASYRFAPAWALFGRLAWQEGYEDVWIDRDLSQRTAWMPLSRMHPLTASLGLRYQNQDFPFWAEAVATVADRQHHLSDSDEADNRYPPDGTPGYDVYDLRAGYTFRQNLDLAIALENVTDETWRVNGSGVNEPGRSLVVTLQYRF